MLFVNLINTEGSFLLKPSKIKKNIILKKDPFNSVLWKTEKKNSIKEKERILERFKKIFIKS